MPSRRGMPPSWLLAQAAVAATEEAIRALQTFQSPRTHSSEKPKLKRVPPATPATRGGQRRVSDRGRSTSGDRTSILEVLSSAHPTPRGRSRSCGNEVSSVDDGVGISEDGLHAPPPSPASRTSRRVRETRAAETVPVPMKRPSASMKRVTNKVTEWFCKYEHGVDIRFGPSISESKTRAYFEKGDMFLVNEELLGDDGVLYLRLADGQGWVFDQKPGVGVICQRLGQPVISKTAASRQRNKLEVKETDLREPSPLPFESAPLHKALSQTPLKRSSEQVATAPLGFAAAAELLSAVKKPSSVHFEMSASLKRKLLSPAPETDRKKLPSGLEANNGADVEKIAGSNEVEDASAMTELVAAAEFASMTSTSRRPQRARFPVLQHWRNERLIFERQKGSDVPSVAAVVVTPTSATTPRKAPVSELQPTTQERFLRNASLEGSKKQCRRSHSEPTPAPVVDVDLPSQKALQQHLTKEGKATSKGDKGETFNKGNVDVSKQSSATSVAPKTVREPRGKAEKATKLHQSRPLTEQPEGEPSEPSEVPPSAVKDEVCSDEETRSGPSAEEATDDLEEAHDDDDAEVDAHFSQEYQAELVARQRSQAEDDAQAAFGHAARSASVVRRDAIDQEGQRDKLNVSHTSVTACEQTIIGLQTQIQEEDTQRLIFEAKALETETMSDDIRRHNLRAQQELTKELKQLSQEQFLAAKSKQTVSEELSSLTSVRLLKQRAEEASTKAAESAESAKQRLRLIAEHAKKRLRTEEERLALVHEVTQKRLEKMSSELKGKANDLEVKANEAKCAAAAELQFQEEKAPQWAALRSEVFAAEKAATELTEAQEASQERLLCLEKEIRQASKLVSDAEAKGMLDGEELVDKARGASDQKISEAQNSLQVALAGSAAIITAATESVTNFKLNRDAELQKHLNRLSELQRSANEALELTIRRRRGAVVLEAETEARATRIVAVAREEADREASELTMQRDVVEQEVKATLCDIEDDAKEEVERAKAQCELAELEASKRTRSLRAEGTELRIRRQSEVAEREQEAARFEEDLKATQSWAKFARNSAEESVRAARVQSEIEISSAQQKMRAFEVQSAKDILTAQEAELVAERQNLEADDLNCRTVLATRTAIDEATEASKQRRMSLQAKEEELKLQVQQALNSSKILEAEQTAAIAHELENVQESTNHQLAEHEANADAAKHHASEALRGVRERLADLKDALEAAHSEASAASQNCINAETSLGHHKGLAEEALKNLRSLRQQKEQALNAHKAFAQAAKARAKEAISTAWQESNEISFEDDDQAAATETLAEAEEKEADALEANLSAEEHLTKQKVEDIRRSIQRQVRQAWQRATLSESVIEQAIGYSEKSTRELHNYITRSTKRRAVHECFEAVATETVEVEEDSGSHSWTLSSLSFRKREKRTRASGRLLKAITPRQTVSGVSLRDLSTNIRRTLAAEVPTLQASVRRLTRVDRRPLA